jgi:DNA repair photolyase
MMAIRFKRKTKENWHVMKQRLSANLFTPKVRGRIMFPTSHDLHIEHVDWWFPFLKALLKNGNDVLIVSKPQLAAITYICDNLMRFNRRMEFRFTIGTDDDTTRQFWEPNAPSIKERILALQLAREAGYQTSVSMEPLLMFHPDVKPFVKRTEPYVTGEIWIGLMNYLWASDFTPEEMRWYDRQVRINSRENMKMVYDSLKNNPKIRWKDSVRDLLGLEKMTIHQKALI